MRELIIILFCSWPALWLKAVEDRGFTQPDSSLLFGSYDRLLIAKPSATRVVHPPQELPANHGVFSPPSMAHDGSLIAWAFATKQTPGAARGVSFSVGIYSWQRERWKTFGDFDDVGTLAFSSDDGTLAFVAEKGGRSALYLLEVARERFIEWQQDTSLSWSAGGKGGLSWSPNGQQLAIEVQVRGAPEIVIVGLATGVIQRIGAGYEPSWAPNGEWVAYYHAGSCIIVRPDGSGGRAVLTVGSRPLRHRSLGWGLAWSPDSKAILVNAIKGDGPKLDVIHVDIATGNLSTKSRDSLPVFAWTKN